MNNRFTSGHSNTIGGVMRYDQLARYGFKQMDTKQQAEAVHRMAFDGLGDHSIATATGLSVEMVRRVLATLREAQS